MAIAIIHFIALQNNYRVHYFFGLLNTIREYFNIF